MPVTGTPLDEGSALDELAGEFERALLSLNRPQIKRLIARAAGRLTPLEIAERIVGRALDRIGAGWQGGAIALSQVYMSGRMCEELMEELLPPGDGRRKEQPAMAIATLDDYHLLGKRLVTSVLRATGYDLRDYGRATVDEAVRRSLDDRIRVLMISTLMLPSALRVRDVARKLKAASAGVTLVVGGAPFLFDPNLWREVEADAMGRSASEAVDLVEAILGEMR